MADNKFDPRKPDPVPDPRPELQKDPPKPGKKETNEERIARETGRK